MTDNSNLEKMDIDTEAINLMAQGKRHLIVHDYYSAVLSLEEACRLFDSKYGVNADECSEAYLKYGCALLELHRQETGALDGLIDPKPQEEEDDEDDEEEEEVEDEENEEASKTEEKNEEVVKTEEDIMESPKQTETPVEDSKMEATPSDADPNKPSTSTGITDENREEEETEPSNIEVAFEVLTMAKNIFKRQTEHRDDVYLKLSETLQKLGEIFIEWENNNDAIKELEECLEIRKRHLPDDDRLIAETYYHIGLAYSFNSNIDQANSNFQKAVDVIQQRLIRLKKTIEDSENSIKKEELDQEIKELESILPEMKSKIEDCQEQMSTTKLAANDKLEEEKLAEKKKQILTKPISNVSHLVKRKREEPELNGNKKLKNGDSNQNGHSKETVEMQEV